MAMYDCSSESDEKFNDIIIFPVFLLGAQLQCASRTAWQICDVGTVHTWVCVCVCVCASNIMFCHAISVDGLYDIE